VPETDLTSTWNRIADALREELGDFTFHISIAPLEPAGQSGDTLFLKAPEHMRCLVRERYTSAIAEAARVALQRPLTVEIVGEDWVADGGSSAPLTRSDERSPFNPRYSFDQFVIGDGNRLAHAAALVVAEMPAQAYNPLFLCGPPGLGKTHLLQAIGTYVRRYGNDLEVRYATGEAFTAAFVDAVRHGDAGPFRRRFRDVDVLLFDDVHALAAKTKTKEELFHTFNALYESGRQLVFTSDNRPSDLDDFEDRLRERFGSGLVAELTPPALSVRRTILRKRAADDAITLLDDRALDEIARQVSGSVRSLEAALVRVVARCSLLHTEPSPALIREAVGQLESTPASGPFERIQAVVAERFGILPSDLIAHDRRPALARPRQLAMYLARETTDASLPAIGRAFGGRHHSTVGHAETRVRAQLERDEDVRTTIAELRRELG